MAIHAVTSGENATLIAKKYGTTVEALQKANSQYSQFTSNPNYIQAGWNLNIPDAAPPVVTPSTPTAPKPIEPPSMNSSVPSGQDFLTVRKNAGLPTDELAIKQTYRDRGFDQKYGEWRGSTEQYKAMQFQDIEDVKKKITDTQTQIENAKAAGYGEGGQYAGQDIPQSALNGGEVNSTYKYTPMSGEDYTKVMDGIVEKIGSTDLTRLISDFAGETLTTPELELSKEEKDAKLAEIKSAAAAGLSTLQKGLAAKGMTFSGIRTTAEANLAADTLAKESGINREFAGKIIDAARQEQGRRETALQAAETNYNKALEAQGYVYNPFTDTIEPTLAGKNFALDVYKAGQPKTVNQPASYDEWTLAGGKEGTGMDYGSWLDRNKSTPAGEIMTTKDFYSAVDKGKTDLQQGESWGNVWNRIKQQFPNMSNDKIDNALGISWKEPGAYQKWAETKKAGQSKVEFTMPDGTKVSI